MTGLRLAVGWALAAALVVTGCDRDAEPGSEPTPTYGAHVIDLPNAPRDADIGELCDLLEQGPADDTGVAALRFGLDLVHLGTPASFSDAARRGWEGSVAPYLAADPAAESFDGESSHSPDTRADDVAAYRVELFDCLGGPAAE